MKKLFIAIALLAGLKAGAQETKDSTAPYMRFPDVPPFTIMTTPDSVAFTKADLKKKKPVLIIYFSPDCDHCKHFTKELLDNYSVLKNVQVVMVSSLNFDLIKRFYQEYKIADYPNIHLGRDGTDFFRTFFNVRAYPTIMLYGKKGNFIKRFDGTATAQKIADEL